MGCCSRVIAQRPCPTGVRIDGVVADPGGAVVAGAHVQASDGEVAITDAAGHFLLSCIPFGFDKLAVQAEGFATVDFPGGRPAGKTTKVTLKLAMLEVEEVVQVTEDPTSMDPDHGGGTLVIDTKAVQRLADDPDDFLRQLQVLASADGGSPANALISVDGFENGSALPPKSSIASIRVNPDLFSSQYRFPPFAGGLIEIFTKPGANSFHGSIFYSNSAGAFNATNPFSVSATPASKERYGVDLTGPIIPRKSGFALALERRVINEFNVVNATTLDVNDNPLPIGQTVATPQRLWTASVRGDWQVTSKDVAVVSYSASVNNVGNQGVGGLVLAEAGYSSLVSEYDVRLLNSLTLNPDLLNETRIGYAWKRRKQNPNSRAASLQVSGYFTGGGAISQDYDDRERNLEIDDDLLLNHGKHLMKFGAQSLGEFVHDYDPDIFNGAYTFGGGSAPALDANNKPTGQTTTVSAIQQYQRALSNLPGGLPTTYELTSGSPQIPLTQWRLGLYTQDDIKVANRLTLSIGLRYQLQTTPDNFLNFGPRLSLAWSPDKKQSWVLRARAGLFHNSPQGPTYAKEVYRLNGIRQQQTTVYRPNFSDPLVPVPGSVSVRTIDQFPPSLSQQSTFAGMLAIEHEFSRHWHSEAHFYWAEDWNNVLQRNINAPLVASSVGSPPDLTAALHAPRPLAPNTNILQYQNAGHLSGNSVSLHIEQRSYKRFTVSANYRHMIFKSGPDDSVPQSSYTNSGESARVDWLRENGGSLSGTLNLPCKFELSTQFDAYDGTPYNITTGNDNNGDGNFNDRPSYATGLGSGVYKTPYGLLTANTVNGNTPRNLGSMPGKIHFDMSLSRAFRLDKRNTGPSRILSFNARIANLLNHTNVTAIQTVLSPSLGQPLTAEAARRIELGARLSF